MAPPHSLQRAGSLNINQLGWPRAKIPPCLLLEVMIQMWRRNQTFAVPYVILCKMVAPSWGPIWGPRNSIYMTNLYSLLLDVPTYQMAELC